MRFVRVNEIPPSERRRSRAMSLKTKLERFMKMDIPLARVDYTPKDYSSPTGCLKSLTVACDMHNIPAYVIMRNGYIYIVRTDITDEDVLNKIFGGKNHV